MDNITEDLTYKEFYMRENETFHLPVETEMNFYDCIKHGKIDEVMKAYKPLGGKGFGTLSDDPLRNLKYHLVITVAFTTRFCIEGGMERETAYNLSDLYIMQADNAQSQQDINRIHREAITDFTSRMAKINKKKMYSRPIIMCFEYVYNNLNQRILISDIAQSIGLTVPYLSKLFHGETGMTLTEYIQKKRIETACRMLRYSGYKATEIGSFLAFSSHSHFIQVFRKEVGMTPKQYQDKHYHISDEMKGGIIPYVEEEDNVKSST